MALVYVQRIYNFVKCLTFCVTLADMLFGIQNSKKEARQAGLAQCFWVDLTVAFHIYDECTFGPKIHDGKIAHGDPHPVLVTV